MGSNTIRPNILTERVGNYSGLGPLQHSECCAPSYASFLVTPRIRRPDFNLRRCWRIHQIGLDLLINARNPVRDNAALQRELQRRFSFFWNFRTPIRSRPKFSCCLLPMTPKKRTDAQFGPVGQALSRRRSKAVDLSVPARRRRLYEVREWIRMAEHGGIETEALNVFSHIEIIFAAATAAERKAQSTLGRTTPPRRLVAPILWCSSGQSKAAARA